MALEEVSAEVASKEEQLASMQRELGTELETQLTAANQREVGANMSVIIT